METPRSRWSSKYFKGLRGIPGVFADESADVPTAEVDDYIALVRAVGLVKYESRSNIFLRGQAKCYGNLVASAYRNQDRVAVDSSINGFVRMFFAATGLDADPIHRVSSEPVLQHYGLRTRWLDLVDSIPHALFFAVYDFEQDPGRPRGEMRVLERPDKYGYVYLIDCGSDRQLRPVSVLDGEKRATCRGVWATADGFRLVDLRRAKPSQAARPHAQHGLLCRASDSELDIWNRRVKLRIRVEREKAKAWLGDGAALSFATLFPSREADAFLPNFSRQTGLGNGRLLGQVKLRPWGGQQLSSDLTNPRGQAQAGFQRTVRRKARCRWRNQGAVRSTRRSARMGSNSISLSEHRFATILAGNPVPNKQKPHGSARPCGQAAGTSLLQDRAGRDLVVRQFEHAAVGHPAHVDQPVFPVSQVLLGGARDFAHVCVVLHGHQDGSVVFSTAG